MKRLIIQSIMSMLILTVMTGLIYPLVVTGIGQLLFNHQANGSIIMQGGRAIGSEQIGQAFTSPGYFWSRPSATGSVAYNAA